jgi:hypothetical protein
VRAPGSNVTLALVTRAGSGACNSGSMRTEPVKYSVGPLRDGCEPFRVISIVVFLRTSLRSSWSPFPGISDFRGAETERPQPPWKQSARNPETKLTRWNAPIRGYLAPPQEISAVRRLIGGAMRTRTKDPDGFIDGARRDRWEPARSSRDCPMAQANNREKSNGTRRAQ